MLYAVVRPVPHRRLGKWSLLRNKRQALLWAKESDGEVWAHPDVPEITTWDWPTFRIGATRIWPDINA